MRSGGYSRRLDGGFPVCLLVVDDWQLTLVMAILPVIALMVSSATRKFRKQKQEDPGGDGRCHPYLLGNHQGYRVVRSFGGEVTVKRFAAAVVNTSKQFKRS
jgi:subfamily B ATP-binding cassette protein MsbA